ncbi:alpha-1B-glycoprotein-like isoform X2 [Phascolarctos cinereus]|uniref:Venom metalloproteinase inhibitor DM43-like isoform X2 n=1 Tax=Phascolarctos cinereus TaxID=38626 RepID=A0A6P5IZL8_PHACI|nr:venom metalloproteinase inhibitor DM43-like isoform X2 [Phascolarctos cinereus]
MAARLTILLLLGLWLDPGMEAEAGLVVDTTPRLWIESESPSSPWANVTLQCLATNTLAMKFQLLKDGKIFSSLSALETYARFPLGPVTADNKGIYRCRIQQAENHWGLISAPVEVTGADSLPKPSLESWVNLVIRPGGSVTFRCRTRFSGLEFKLLKDGEEVFVPMMSSTDPQLIDFHLKDLEPGAGGRYSCRYRFREGPLIWSEDSESLELVLTTGTLDKPSLSVQPQDAVISRGTNVTLQCLGARPNVRFALLKKGSRQPVQVLSPAGSRADFVLSDAMAYDSGNYSCIYFETVAPFAGSPASEDVEVQVDGLFPKPTLHPLSPVVTPGKDAALRCSGRVPNSNFQLFRDGESTELEVTHQRVSEYTVDFLLRNAKPQDGGRYRCRYLTWTKPILTSEISDPAEISVTGKIL